MSVTIINSFSNISQFLLISFFAVILICEGFSVQTNLDTSSAWGEAENFSQIEDDRKIYKNPRNSPSNYCPRDEEQATLLGQKCLRKCSSDEDCKSRKKKCLCDGVCGMSCIKPDKECPDLAQPILGQVTVTGKHFGDRASYFCPPDYHVVGLQSRLCQADGNWAGAEPACKQNIYCLKPPQIEHARHSAIHEQETFDLDSTVQYHCLNGYVTNGFPRAKCLAIDGQASWYGPDIQCEARSCGQPSDPAFGWHAGECYTYGCKIKYNCGSGYELVGKYERVCQSDGSWTPKELPTCVLVTSVVCPTPENPKNGKATYTTLSYNSVVSYECRYGYTLVGETSSRCGADGKWSGILPICKEINCGHPGILYNGWIENIEGGTGLGSGIIFRCHPGMMLQGHASSVCQIDGHWRNPNPECLAPCVVPRISQGYVISIEMLNDGNTTSTATPTLSQQTLQSDVVKVKHGTVLDVKCEENYEFPMSHLNSPTCNNGTWSVIPRCIPSRCKEMPKPPRHGIVLAPKSDHGMKARFKCKDGFKLVNSDGVEVVDTNEYVLTCSFGNWTGISLKCVEVFCAFPGYIPNGKVLLVGNMGLYDYRPYVKKIANNKQIMYDCDKGYVIEAGPSGATCVGGKWRPLELPQCSLGQHPRLRWSRKRRSVQYRYMHSKFLWKAKRIFKRKSEDFPEQEGLLKDRNEKIADVPKQLKRNSFYAERPFSQYFKKIECGRYSDNTAQKNTQIKSNLLDNLSHSLFSTKFITTQKPGKPHKIKSFFQNNSYNLSHPNVIDNIQNLSNVIQERKFPSDHKLWKRSSTQRSNKDLDFLDEKSNARMYCENLNWNSFSNVILIKPGERPGKNSPGVMLGLQCSGGLKNYNNFNLTIKCIEGVWQPKTPKCGPDSCFVPEISNGKYYKMESYPKFTERSTLSTDEEILSNEFIKLICEDHYTIQGSERLQCVHGNWSVSTFPECVPLLPVCLLPALQGVIYEGGYREGLTVSHGSSVNLRCSNTVNPQYMKVHCNQGVLEPYPIHCESELVMHEEKYMDGQDYENSQTEEVNTIAEVQNITEEAKMCGSPSILDNALVYKNMDVAHDGMYESGTEMYFNCIPSIAGERNTWRIICENGQWTGRSYNCANGTCLFKNNEPHVVNFYNDLEIREDTVQFPPGATIVSRCTDIGKFKMFGSTERTCIHSEWTGTKPSCFGLNQENDYAMEKAPTILFRHEDGPISQSNDGKLIVYPGTTLHMECLWMRRFGNPKWSVSHNYRNYSEGWVTEADENRDANLEYRLSILKATEKDSGIYTCQTPARHEHSVEVVVKAINCSEIPTRRGLILTSNETKLGSKILFSCTNGNSLIGASELICLPSGNWSAPLPVCESIECGDIPMVYNSSSPRVAVLSREVGGRAAFSCSSGYGLRGPSESICMPSGEWTTPLPICVEVQCNNPGAPQNGYAQGSMPYRAGDVVQFNCSPGYMMEGQPIIACQDNGRWSGNLPKCVQACSYPGTTISGRMSSVKFYYSIGEIVTFTCDIGLELQGSKMLKCMRNGKWSNAIPTCISAHKMSKTG